MKKLLFSLLAVSVIACIFIMPAHAAERELTSYTSSVSTYPITEAATMAAQISNTARIHNIVVSNTQAAVPQVVTFYKDSASTTTVTSAFVVNIASDTDKNFQITYPIPASPWAIDNLSIRKSSTASDVNVTIWYR